MSRAFLYILKRYFITFFIVSIGMVSIVSLIDFLQHIGSIRGANRAMLYFYYTFNNTFTLLYPIALVFAAIIVLSSLLFKNHLLSLASFGYPKSFIIKPLLLASLIIYFIVVGLNFTKFAYAGDKAEAILNSENSSYSSLDNIFFKYNNSFVAAKKLDIVNKELKGINLYHVDNEKVDYILEIKSAKFSDGSWVANGITKKIFKYRDGVPIGYDVEKLESAKILRAYYPKVIKLLYEGKRMSITDGIKAQKLLKKQNIDNSKIESALYQKLLMPLFAPILIVLLSILTPIHKRYFGRAKFFFYSLGATLVIWTLLYSVNMMSVNGVVPVYLGQPLIILALIVLTLAVWIRKRSTI